MYVGVECVRKERFPPHCIGLNVIACMYAYIDVYTHLYNVFKDIMNRTELQVSRYTLDCILHLEECKINNQ